MFYVSNVQINILNKKWKILNNLNVSSLNAKIKYQLMKNIKKIILTILLISNPFHLKNKFLLKNILIIIKLWLKESQINVKIVKK
jgi:hypothetical protein